MGIDLFGNTVKRVYKRQNVLSMPPWGDFPGFMRWWDEHEPKRGPKRLALWAWVCHCQRGMDLEGRVDELLAAWGWTAEKASEVRWIPHEATWLRQARWDAFESGSSLADSQEDLSPGTRVRETRIPYREGIVERVKTAYVGGSERVLGVVVRQEDGSMFSVPHCSRLERAREDFSEKG